jgi:glycosyltransferase involved in cell wall biosynthesis
MVKPLLQSESRKMSQPKGRKVNVVFDMTFPRRLKTGTTVYANELVAALREREACRVTCLAEQVPVCRGGIRKVWNGIRNLIWIQIILPVKLMSLKADVLHAPSYFAPLLWCPCPIVLTVHDTLYLIPSLRFRDRLFYLYARAFIAGAIRRANIVCTVSNAARNDVISLFRVPDERVRVIYHGVNSRFQPQSEARIAEFRHKHGLDLPFFLFVGTWEPRKNLPRLIEAFGLFLKDVSQEYDLLLVGPPDDGAIELRRILENPESSKHVRLLGFLADAEMPCVYSAADAFVFPSLGEGFGMPIIEAMACGTPVITSDLSCLPEVAGDAALLINPTDPVEIAKAMERVLRADVRQELKSRGLQRARFFTWQKTAEETEKAYLDVQVSNGGLRA